MYTHNKSDSREDVERKRKKWYIRACRDERVPERIYELEAELGYELSEQYKITDKINRTQSVLENFYERKKFLKKATWKDYDKYGEKFEYASVKIPLKEFVKPKLTKVMILGYLSKELSISEYMVIKNILTNKDKGE
jgi:hypothetical protein